MCTENTAGTKLKDALILYGSQTGQAESIAELIVERAIDVDHLPALRLNQMNDIDKQFKLENEQLIIIICSSTGDGDPPDNATKFYRRINRKTLSLDHLSHLRFALLGLGDTNYNSYLKCPKSIEKRLLDLGAKRFYKSGFCDDAVGLELVADPWMDGLFEILPKALADISMIISEDEQPGRVTESLASDLHAKVRLSSEPSNANAQLSTVAPTNQHSCESEDQSPPRPIESTGAKDVSEPFNLINSAPLSVTPSDRVLIDAQNKPAGEVDSKTDSNAELSRGSSQDVQPVNIFVPKCLIDSPEPSTTCQCLWPSESLRYSSALAKIANLTVPKVSPSFLQPELIKENVERPMADLLTRSDYPSQASEVFPSTLINRTLLTKSGAKKEKFEIILSLPKVTKKPNVKATKGIAINDKVSKHLNYDPGDAFYFICPNHTKEVNWLINSSWYFIDAERSKILRFWKFCFQPRTVNE